MSDIDTPNTNPVSPKVTVASLVTLALAVIAAILNNVQADASLLGDLPGWAQFLIIAALPPVLTFLASYRTTDPARRVGLRGRR